MAAPQIGGLDAFMRGVNDELDAAQAAARQLAQEPGPQGLGLREADVHAQNLAASVRVDANGDNDRHRDDAAVAPGRRNFRLRKHKNPPRVQPQLPLSGSRKSEGLA